MLKKMSCLVLCFLLLISDSSILVMATGESQTSGWVYENEHWYLYDSDGVMQTGWHKVGGNTYHLSETGEMTSGWLYECRGLPHFPGVYGRHGLQARNQKYGDL